MNRTIVPIGTSAAATRGVVGFPEVSEGGKNGVEAACRDFPETSPAHGAEYTRGHAAWLIRLRWVALLCTAALLAASAFITRVLTPANMQSTAACIAALAALNAAYSRRQKKTSRPSRFILVQILGDLIALTALLHFTGGLSNPLHIIYVFHVVIASIVLPRPSARGVTLVACALFTFLAVAEHFGWIPHRPLLLGTEAAARDPLRIAGTLFAFNLVLTGAHVFTTLIVQQMRAAETRLADLARKATDERTLLEAVVNGAGVGMRLLSRDRVVLWQNRRVEEWFCSAGVVGRVCLSSFGGPVLGCSTCLCEQAMHSGISQFCERRVGDRRYMVTASPVCGDDGQVHQVVEVIRDVTEERETASQLVQAAKLAAIGELAASVAHEVNNPIGIIMGKAGLLLSRSAASLPPPAVAEIEKINEQAHRVAEVTRSLLGFSRTSPFRRDRLDLNHVVTECLALTRARIESSHIRLETRLAHDLPAVTGGFTELQQVLLNLVNNAVDAMPSGGLLTIATGKAGERDVELAVADNGGGIPAANLDRVFDPFYSTKGPAGTGLGLTIARRIVRDHDGDILVDSEVGKGSRFRVRLPEAHP